MGGRNSDVIVVGAGIVGLFAAWELAKAGLSVRIYERGPVGAEASWAAGGILCPLYPWNEPEEVQAMAAWSQAHYQGLCEQLHEATGIDPEWTRSGLLLLDGNEEGNAIAWATRFRVPHASVPASGVLFPEVAQVRSPRLLAALRSQVERCGVAVHEYSRVQEILTKRRHVHGVRVDGVAIQAPCVVVAAGAWCDTVMKDFPVGVTPVKGEMLLYRLGKPLRSAMVLSAGCYAIPRRDGHLLVGSTIEDAGFCRQPTERAAAYLRQAASRLVPELASAQCVAQWSGLRPRLQGERCHTGPHAGIQGLFVSTGHYRNGILLAPATAANLAGQISQALNSAA